MNFFDTPEAAALYAKGRPYYHQAVVDAALRRAAIPLPVALALDVACGTGLSTLALRSFARQIIGVDVSAAMLALAPPADNITYLLAPAEALPLADNSCDLLTLSEAFHWLDQPIFLQEAGRVLRPGGIFLVYGDGIRGEMQEDPDFSIWFGEVHLSRFPHPVRGERFQADTHVPEGFTLIAQDRHDRFIPMTPNMLADFLLSISNTLMYMEQTGVRAAALHHAFVEELLPFFEDLPTTLRHIRFGGLYWLLRKNDDARSE